MFDRGNAVTWIGENLEKCSDEEIKDFFAMVEKAIVPTEAPEPAAKPAAKPAPAKEEKPAFKKPAAKKPASKKK